MSRISPPTFQKLSLTAAVKANEPVDMATKADAFAAVTLTPPPMPGSPRPNMTREERASRAMQAMKAKLLTALACGVDPLQMRFWSDPLGTRAKSAREAMLATAAWDDGAR
ncbi:hypothetical protein [Caenimonas koreensis]|uniref:Uncharacterized protein n=1 Tax=Caenimonas koreensis DSM 17982 TaxID=1121255 RepID=A0A844B6C5_9BURK|nr:hypothetical protein [Caenimonas koreensis]MRD47057.1 hypothetical protein [Caenimonas koreensis DSM 17982]